MDAVSMDLEQLMGRYFRLRQELEQAYEQSPWHSGRIDRLTDDIAAVERELSERQTEAERLAASVLA